MYTIAELLARGADYPLMQPSKADYYNHGTEIRKCRDYYGDSDYWYEVVSLDPLAQIAYHVGYNPEGAYEFECGTFNRLWFVGSKSPETIFSKRFPYAYEPIEYGEALIDLLYAEWHEGKTLEQLAKFIAPYEIKAMKQYSKREGA